MDYIVHDLIGECVFVYIDDIIMYSKNIKKYARYLEKVFELISAAGLKFKPSKFHFSKEKVELLGYMVSNEGTKVNPNKVQPIIELKEPNSTKGVRLFLEMVEFYRETIHNFAKIAKPLVELTQKNVTFRWGIEQNNAFNLLKNELRSSNVMAP